MTSLKDKPKWVLENPRDGVEYAYIDHCVILGSDRYLLFVKLVSLPRPDGGEGYKSLTSAKAQYTKCYQSPCYNLEKPKWRKTTWGED